jgi:dipeptidyl aminopeptidase/acylaminoacyl peptidase
MFKCLVRAWLLAATLMSTAAIAQTAKLSVEDFFRHPQYRSLGLSPDGEYIAATTPIGGRMNLVVMGVKERKPIVLTNEQRFDIIEFHWVSSKRLIFSLGNINEPSGSDTRTGGGLFAVDRDGGEFRTLAPTLGQQIGSGNLVARMMNYVGLAPDMPDEIIVSANERSTAQSDVYRLNTRNGRKTLLTYENPGAVSQWVLDKSGVPRAAVSGNAENSSFVWYRKDGESKWERIGESRLFEKNFLPLSFGYDGTFYVISNLGRDKYAIYTFDSEIKKPKDLVFEHPDVDVGVSVRGVGADANNLIFDHKTKKLAGIRFEADKPAVKWVDADWEKLANEFGRAMPGSHLVYGLPSQSSRMVVRTYSDRQSSTYYLFDQATKKMEYMLASRPWLKEADMVEMKPLRFKARDGLEIPAYLFLPRGHEGKKLPLVVNIHGGPHVRADRWHLDMWGPMESQFLAHHGYAVLLTNFRMTPGFGHQLYTAGIRQMGLAMQEDIEDGVDHLIKQGLVDEKRVCLYGASYGGYATLWGLVKTPDKYACGVGALVMSDIHLQLTSNRTDFTASKRGVHFWSKMAGDPATEPDYLRSISPAFHADKIKAPLFIISGEADRRTPLEQAEKMREAMQKVGKNPEWMVKPEEGHGFAKLENRVDMYSKMLEFFNKHIGDRK